MPIYFSYPVSHKRLWGYYCKSNTWLISLEWNEHFKSRNVHFKHLLTVKVLHLVSAGHAAHFGPQVAAADILVMFPLV